jgi:hypothetical protein
MTPDEADAYIRRLVDEAPPLREEQIEELTLLLRPRGPQAESLKVDDSAAAADCDSERGPHNRPNSLATTGDTDAAYVVLSR